VRKAEGLVISKKEKFSAFLGNPGLDNDRSVHWGGSLVSS